ncbi:ABC transporter substrate-binding protein [Robertmurraya massiliosenegalensis]|uniref:ABC transporter substrate-binding protein n=1 Tax=Robertmurraya massiliosenegalensis TaxID=1287657 RepID=UPI0002DDA517|nr:helical backbone metal receptor [Robertmurraya massiliosenegalensis]
MLKKMEDHLGRKVGYHFPPQRIVSICPGITETLYELGLEKEIVGRTRYCIFPEDKVAHATIVGGTKDIDIEIVKSLNPDVIIAEKEENTKEMVALLARSYPVFVAEVQSIQDSYRMIEDMGNITNFESNAKNLINAIKNEFNTIPKVNGKRAAYVIWRNPYMVVGSNTYINSVMEAMGFENPFSTSKNRYPSVTKEELQESQLDYIFLATEPFHFKEKHKKEFQEFIPNVPPMIVDGEMFWYGAKMKVAAEYFRTFITKIIKRDQLF